MRRFQPHRFFLAFFLACVCFLMPFCVQAASYADFRSELRYQDQDREAVHGGEVMVAGARARLDVRLGKAGLFTLLVDMEQGWMQVLSHRLKAYVESPVEGDPHNWRDLVRSASSVLFPQTFGMVSFEEKSCQKTGRERVGSFEADKSRCVFSLGFMGSLRDITVDVWESDAFAPFPLKAAVVEDRRTRGGAAWLDRIESVRVAEEHFLVPADYTRFTSILDLILYALSAF